MLKANQLAPQFLEGPFGGKLTLEEIAQLEPAMTADNLAKALTLLDGTWGSYFKCGGGK